MYSVCELSAGLPISEVMEEFPGLVNELFGMRHSLEQVFYEHSYQQSVVPSKHITKTPILPPSEENATDGSQSQDPDTTIATYRYRPGFPR